MKVTRRLWGAAGLVAGAMTMASAVSVGTANAAATYVVDNASSACSDEGPGTSSRPFCTIGAAADEAEAGDTVLVSAGTYPGTSVNPASSGTPTSRITFQARPGAAIVGGTRAFALSGRSNIVISGFAITGTSSYGISVSGGTNVVISGNRVSARARSTSGAGLPTGPARR